jgi:hypothetical protein
MTEIERLTALVNVIVAQRDQALNALASVQVDNAALQQKLKKMEAESAIEPDLLKKATTGNGAHAPAHLS